jgi:hypothetical protein
MTRFSLLLLPVLALCFHSVRDAEAQVAGPEIEVAARGISYIKAQLEGSGGFSRNPVVVIDPQLINEKLSAQNVELPERASQIAQLVSAKVGRISDNIKCADTIPGGCRMSAAMVFRVSQPVIQGDTATVQIMYWWYAPQFRYATPSAGVELYLVRSGGQWSVVNERQIMMS